MKSLLILNQYFPPDQAATGQLLGQLAQGLAKDLKVTVICGTPTYAPDSNVAPFSFQVRRVPLLPGSRKFLPLRILNYLFFLIGSFFLAVTTPRHDFVMCWTDPPLIGLIGAFLRWTKGSRFIFVSQDVYPEIARAAGKMSDPFSIALLTLASRIILKAADKVVAVGHDMKEVLLGKGVEFDRVVVIRNWQDLDVLKPEAKIPFRRENGISETDFVVMHSGNIGVSQDFETLLSVAEKLRGEPVTFVIIGDGARQEKLSRMIHFQKLANVKMFPYQPGPKLAQALSAADLHYVSLKKEFLGLIVPSKLFGIMAVARPVLCNVPKGSDVETIVKEADCGILASANPENLRAALEEARSGPEHLVRFGRNGRRWIEENGGRSRAVQAYMEAIARSTS
jgi:colanic acid biosynthesis glycosyl transferase WcaI